MKNKNLRFALSECWSTSIRATGITVVIAILFYQSIWGCILFPLVWRFCYIQVQQEIKQKRMQALEEQFMHGMQTLNRALQAGLSMENAWRQVQKETKLMYGESSEFYQKLKDMNHSVGLNIPIEQLFLEFAYTSELEDAIGFAEVFAHGKRSGGNWKRMIDSVLQHMKERYDARKEITVLVAEKQMEQRIMNLMPLGMIAFLQISAKDYMAVLYHNWFGVLCMSVCLVCYVAAIVLSEKILRIRV